MCRKKLSPLRRKLRRSVIVCLALLILFMTYFELAVKAQLKGVILREMHTMAQQATAEAVDEYLSAHPDIGHRLCEIVDNDGSVAAVTTNSACINSVKTAVIESTQQKLDELSHAQGVSARLGSFTGLVFLTNVGPIVHFAVDSARTVSCEFQSSFEGAGVNQTVHHITMTVTVDLLVCNPYHIDETVSAESTFEIAQTVIVGAVPSYSGVVTY